MSNFQLERFFCSDLEEKVEFGFLLLVFWGLSILVMVPVVANGDDLLVGTGLFGSLDFRETSCALFEREGKQPVTPLPDPMRNLRIDD